MKEASRPQMMTISCAARHANDWAGGIILEAVPSCLIYGIFRLSFNPTQASLVPAKKVDHWKNSCKLWCKILMVREGGI
jgi:hypothetical protein